MSEKLRPLLLAAVLSIMWYGFVGFLDRGLMSHQLPSLTLLCLSRYLPPGTIHNPEGQPVQPGADYVFVPLGLQCTFTMTDGSTTQSFHPRYVQTAIAGLPIVLTLVLAARSLLELRRKQRAKIGRARSRMMVLHYAGRSCGAVSVSKVLICTG